MHAAQQMEQLIHRGAHRLLGHNAHAVFQQTPAFVAGGTDVRAPADTAIQRRALPRTAPGYEQHEDTHTHTRSHRPPSAGTDARMRTYKRTTAVIPLQGRQGEGASRVGVSPAVVGWAAVGPSVQAAPTRGECGCGHELRAVVWYGSPSFLIRSSVRPSGRCREHGGCRPTPLGRCKAVQ